MLHQSVSKFKKDVYLASFLNHKNPYYEKFIWRLLLKQYLLENGSYPIKYNKEGYATDSSLNNFEKIMDKYTERILTADNPLFWENNDNVIVLRYKTGLFENFIKLTKI